MAVSSAACSSTPPPPPASPKSDSPTAANDCAHEIALTCDAGMKDGCLLPGEGGHLTSTHVCVPETEKSGPPCEQEIARVCDAGLVDACLLKPPPAATHVCVKGSI